MDPWEQVAVRFLDSAAQTGISFGAAYGQNWLQTSNLEAQLELAARYRPAAPPAANGLLLLLIGVGVVFLAKA